MVKSNKNIETKLLEYVNKKLFNSNEICSSLTKHEIMLFFEEAKAQQVECLIYDEVLKMTSEFVELKSYMDIWRSFVMMRTLRHNQTCREVSKVFHAFNESGISYVTLKGYVFKELYPDPKMRYMGDVDLYVDKKDIMSATDLLRNSGYVQKVDANHPFHLTFKKDGLIDIELHYNFFHDDLFQNNYYLENNVWENTRIICVDSIQVSVPSLEHSLVHGILHIATHFSGKGFGLRQLTDICLFMEKYAPEISFPEVRVILESYNSVKIYGYIMEMCNRFFNKKYDLFDVEINDDKLNHLNNLLFDSGVFGHKSYGNEIQRIVTKEKIKHNIKSKNSLRLKFIVLFPNAERIGDKYKYAKKYKFLLPVAWVHRLIHGFIKPSEASKELLKNKINVKGIEDKIELLDFFGLNINNE